MSDTKIQRPKPVWLLLAIAALAWFLFHQLSLEWRLNPQYSYGWVVPILTAYLVLERWRDRPTPNPSRHHRILLFTALALLIPLSLAQEANPDWRLTSWIAALLTVTFLWLGFAAAGGTAWRKHFAFATAFLLTSVPWPTPFENALVLALMRDVAAVAVELLNFLGIAAEQQGNLIHLTGGSLGVDEACSGIRSFQATIMTTLFLGELHRLATPRRLILIVIGSIYALLLNLLRALGLALIASRYGIPTAERLHDPAGYILLTIIFLGLWFFAKRVGRPATAGCAPSDLPSAPYIPQRESILLLAFIINAQLLTQLWYRSHEHNDTPRTQWTAAWPADPPALVPSKISENIKLILRYNTAEAATWNRPDGSRWHLFFFTWKPGRAAAQLARAHRPETCLPATGYEFYKNRGVTNLHIANLDLPIERIDFKNSGQLIHVYYCLWEDRTAPYVVPSRSGADGSPSVLTRSTRLTSILEGRRHLGQRVLEIVIEGLDDPAQSDAAFEDSIAQWIKAE